jgi:hypothetical protein
MSIDITIHLYVLVEGSSDGAKVERRTLVDPLVPADERSRVG